MRVFVVSIRAKKSVHGSYAVLVHCTCLFVESREQIACQDWIEVAGTHGHCTDVVEMAQQEAEVRPVLAIDPTCPHGLHYFPDARRFCKMVLVVANIAVEVAGQSALELLETLRVPGLYGLLASIQSGWENA